MASYTVAIVPLRSSINGLDALRFFLWVKKLQELEREKDMLWLSLPYLEETKYWIQSAVNNPRIGKLKTDMVNATPIMNH
ncbi:suppressor APC domain-containing protein 1-like [Trichomycterus rosablanca]|uniref:suppressor APC domain-containing protein 1-like n=1 Tax=Trichomycterus rosablanca TaxID=2290929 RepID=UPI002F34FC88